MVFHIIKKTTISKQYAKEKKSQLPKSMKRFIALKVKV